MDVPLSTPLTARARALSRLTVHAALLALTLGLGAPRATAQSALPIAPVYQQTPVWCWAAVGEMVFRYYGVANINPVANFQCGVVALLHPTCELNCGNCVVPAGSLQTMDNMLRGYPAEASRRTATDTRISTSTYHAPLSYGRIRREIDAGRPVVAGISPSGYRVAGVSEHVALIIGYDDGDLLVNDPFPFDFAFTGNPYTAAGAWERELGQYVIAYEDFVARLQWQEGIYRIRCSGASCADDASYPELAPHPDPAPIQYGRSCCTNVGRCGPFFNQPALPLGSSCYCATPYGPATGTVCQ